MISDNSIPKLIGYRDSTLVYLHPDKTCVIKKREYLYEYIKSLFQSLVENSFNVQFVDHKYFCKYSMGDVVILVGNSTAGKSSIIKALLQQETDRIEDGVDLQSEKIDLSNIKKYCSQELAFLKTVMKTEAAIPNAVFTKERLWRLDTSSQEKLDGEEAIKRIKTKFDALSEEENRVINTMFKNLQFSMLDDAFENSRRGRNVVLDVLDLEATSTHLLRRAFNGPLRIVLAFCPLHVLPSRIDKRNKEADKNGELSNQRIGAFPLMQFSKIFGRNQKGRRPLETLLREDVKKIFLHYFDKGIEFQRNEGCLKDSPDEIVLNRQSKLNDFLTNLGFKEGEKSLEISPKKVEVYNLMLNTANIRPELSAAIIHSGTYVR